MSNQKSGKRRSRSTGSSTHNLRPNSKRAAAPRTLQEFEKLSPPQREEWDKAIEVLRTMREHPRKSLSTASRESEVRPEIAKRILRRALIKRSNGRYSVKPGDQLLRVLRILTPHGPVEIGVRGSRQASTVGEYWAAVQKYIATGDATGLNKLEGKEIRDASGNKITLITNTNELKRLGYAGQLSFESIYARTA
jgi:hypothetical protein